MNEVQVVRTLIRSRGRAPMSWSDRYVALFALATTAAVLAQSSQQWDSWLQGALVALAIVAVLATVLGSGPGRHLLVAVADAPVSLGAASAVLCGTVTTLLVRRAWAALGRVHARTVLAASIRAGQVTTATTALEFGALTWIAEDGHWRKRTLRSRPWPAPLSGSLSGPMPRLLRPLSAPLALAWQDWRRLGRRPGRLAALLAATALPALAAQAGGGLFPVAMILVATGSLTAAVMCTTGARRDGDDPSLARLFGVGAGAALAARALLPLLLSALWNTLALVGLIAAGALPAGPWWLFGPLSAPALAAGALRMARRGPVDHSMPVIDTLGGAVPVGPLVWAMTGVDIAVLGCAPALLALITEPADLGTLVTAQALSGVAVLAAFLLRARRAVAGTARLG